MEIILRVLKFKLCWLVMIFFLCFNVFAEEKIEKVIVFGVGTTSEMATKNAAKNAVKQVVGMYVVSDVEMQNRKIIKDEVLSYSNGYVKTFKMLEMKENEDGLYEIMAEVGVKISQINNKLNSLNIATKNVNINVQEFKAKVITQKDKVKDFEKMVENIVYKPLIKESVYDIKITKFEQLDTEGLLSDGMSYKKFVPFTDKSYCCGLTTASINFPASVASEVKDKVQRRGTFEEYGYYPFLLEFKIYFSEPYLKSVKDFFDSSAKKMRFNAENKKAIFFLGIGNDYNGKEINRTKNRFITAYSFSDKQLKLMRALFKKYYGGKLLKQAIYISIMGNDDSALGNLFYAWSGGEGYNAVSDGRRLVYQGENSGNFFNSDIPALNGLYTTKNPRVRIEGSWPVFGHFIGKYDHMLKFFVQNKHTFCVIMLLKQNQVENIKNINVEIINGN